MSLSDKQVIITETTRGVGSVNGYFEKDVREAVKELKETLDKWHIGESDPDDFKIAFKIAIDEIFGEELTK